MEWEELLQLIPGYNPFDNSEDYYFDEDAAQRAIDFFEIHLKFIEGDVAGKPFILQPFQKAIISNAFGWKNKDGLRRYRELFLLIPRKNGKTPLAAGIILYCGFCEEEGGAQLYSSASSAKQAELIYRHCAGMINKNSYLKDRATVYKGNYKKIEFYEGESFYQALQSKAETNEGLNSQLIVNDELHTHDDRQLIEVLENSTASRSQPLIVHITTAGWDRETICYEKYDYACKVRDGIIKDPSFLPIIYEIKKEDYDNWDNEEVLKYCNPNYGISVKPEYLKRQAQKAKDTPAYLNSFRRYHLNQWVSNASAWLDMSRFDECSASPSDNKQLNWYLGVDLSKNQDLTAIALVAKDSEGIFHIRPYCFIPKLIAQQKEIDDKVSYSSWEKEGFIHLTEGDCIDYIYIKEFIVNLRDKEGYNIKEVVFDAKFASEIIIELSSSYGFEVTTFGQNITTISSPAKKFEELILTKKMRHGGHPVFRWCASNAEIYTDANDNIKPIKKQRNGRNKRIDPIYAVLNSIGRIIWDDTGESGVSIYEQGVFTLN